MATSRTKRRTKQPTMHPTERKAREARAAAERALRLQRKLRSLSGELRRAMTSADDSLRQVARVIIERDELFTQAAVDRVAAGEHAPVGAGSDPRD